MRIKNYEVISRSTKFLGRSLNLVAATNFLLVLDWIDTDKTALFGVHFADGKLALAVFVALIFILLSYSIAWIGEYLSSSSWNIEGLETAFMFFGGDGKSKVDTLRSRSESLLGDFDKSAAKVIENELATKEEFDEEVRKMHSALKALQCDIAELTKSVRTFNLFKMFYVWVWHMFIPASFALASICFVLHA